MKRVLMAVLGLAALAGTSAGASERHFTFTYESAVLPPGKWELEPWNTFRLGKEDYFARLDTRLEAELGLSDRLQTSLYLNLSSRTADTAAGRVELERDRGPVVGVEAEARGSRRRPGRASRSTAKRARDRPSSSSRAS